MIFLALISFTAYLIRENINDYDPDNVNESGSAYATAVMYIVGIIDAIFLIILICKKESFKLAVAVIEVATHFFTSAKRLTFLPVFFCTIIIISIMMIVAAIFCVASIGPIEVEYYELQIKDVERTPLTKSMLSLMIFGLFLVLGFITMGYIFVIDVSAITWYYSDKEKEANQDSDRGETDVIKGLWWSVRYHGGTIAASVFIFLLLWPLIIICVIGKKFEKIEKKNAVVDCCVCCCCCCI